MSADARHKRWPSLIYINLPTTLYFYYSYYLTNLPFIGVDLEHLPPQLTWDRDPTLCIVYNYTMIHSLRQGSVRPTLHPESSAPSLDLRLIEFQPLYHLSQDHQTNGTNCLCSFSEIEPGFLTSLILTLSTCLYSFNSVCFIIFLFLKFKRIKRERWKYILSEQDRYGNLFPSKPAMTKNRNWRQRNQKNNILEITFHNKFPLLHCFRF